MNKYVRNFRQHQKALRIEEAVAIRNDEYLVGGISLTQTMINSYIKKVKDQTGKNLRQMYSDSEIAEQIVKYIVDKHGTVETIPVSALLGGEEGLVDDVDSLETTDTETADVEGDTIEKTEPAAEEKDLSMSMEVSGETSDDLDDTKQSETETDTEDIDDDLFSDDEDAIEFEETTDDTDDDDNTTDTDDEKSEEDNDRDEESDDDSNIRLPI